MSNDAGWGWIVLLMLIIGCVMGSIIEQRIMRGQAIEQHAASYDPYTAEFMWRQCK